MLGIKKITFFLVFASILAPFSYADASEELSSIDYGLAADSPFYWAELFFEDMQVYFEQDSEAKAELTASFADERFAEMYAAMQAGDYEAATDAASAAEEGIHSIEDYISQLPSGEENLDFIYMMEHELLSHEEYSEYLETYMNGQIEAGIATEEDLNALNLDDVEEASVDMQVAAEDKLGEIAETIATEQGLTVVESELVLEQEAAEAGATEFQREEVEGELDDLQEEIDSLYAELHQARERGDSYYAAELIDIISEAGIKLQRSEQSFEDGFYGRAYGELTAAEHLIDNADRFLDGESPEEVREFEKFVESEKLKREEMAAKYAQDFERMKEELKQKYPERADYFEKEYERSQKVMALAERETEEYSKQLQDMINEGTSEAEATRIISQRWAEEYERVYGEKYEPPGMYIDHRIGEEEFRPVGGYVEGYKYEDPVTGYKYEFKGDGYTYTTFLGIEYEEKYPEGYIPPKPYRKGNEEYTYKTDTPEGSYEYRYFATGYEIAKPDGSKETFAYPEGDYKVHGGGEIGVKPYGYRMENWQGNDIRYDYDPKFDTYVSPDGEVYKPTDGAYIHDNVRYSRTAGEYSWTSGEGKTWTYDPDKSTWSSSSGETYTPESNAVAPVGHEDTGSYRTYDGQTWTYNSEVGTWQSDRGETYNHEDHEYSASGRTWNYDGSSGTWTSSDGESWSYDSSGTWESESGESVSYDYSGGDWESSSGESWNYDESSGTWSSSSGGSWTYDSSSNTWTSSSGESYSGCSDCGSYSGGSYSGDGGSYSGSDAGAPSGGDSGGAPSGGY